MRHDQFSQTRRARTGKCNVLISHRLHVEANRGNGCHHLAKFKFVQDGRFAYNTAVRDEAKRKREKKELPIYVPAASSPTIRMRISLEPPAQLWNKRVSERLSNASQQK